MTIEKATQLCIKAHAGQFRRDGKPYHTHPMAVADMLSSDIDKVVALLHDVFEDCEGWNLEVTANGANYFISEPNGDLHPIDDGVYDALSDLTHDKATTTYTEYIQNIADNYTYYEATSALPVKIADLFHNISDMATDANKKKYMKAMKVLLAEL